MIFLRLFQEFFCIGLFSIGGGMATVPFLFDLGARTGWFSAAELANMIAVSESTPGPIGINMATYVGYTTAGPLGSVVAPLALTVPAFLIILLITGIMQKFRQNPHVEGVFYSLRPASTGLITAALISVCAACLVTYAAGSLIFHWKSIGVFLLIFLCLQLPKIKRLHTVVFVLFSAVLGIVLQM